MASKGFSRGSAPRGKAPENREKPAQKAAEKKAGWPAFTPKSDKSKK